MQTSKYKKRSAKTQNAKLENLKYQKFTGQYSNFKLQNIRGQTTFNIPNPKFKTSKNEISEFQICAFQSFKCKTPK